MKIKIVVLSFVTVLILTGTQAQDAKKHYKEINKAAVVYLKDTVFSQGKPYCLMQEVKMKYQTPDYRISNLNGEWIMEAKYITNNTLSNFGYYYLSFSKSKNMVNLKMKDVKELPSLLVKNGLVKDGIVPPPQELQMLNTYSNENEVIYIDGIVYQGGKPYCKMKEININEFHPDYSIRNLNDEELMYVKFNALATGLGAGSYQLIFPSGNFLKLKTTEKKNIPSIIVNSNLIKAGTVRKEAEESYILSKGGVLTAGNNSTDNTFALVNRNVHSDVIILGNNIKQDLVTIGNTKDGEPFYLNKILYHQILFFLPSGQKIAEATFTANDSDGRECRIITLKDLQNFTINLDRSKSEKKQVAEFLINRGYL